MKADEPKIAFMPAAENLHTSTAHTHDVCVRGVGVVGSTLALALAKAGFTVALQSDAAKPAGRSEDVRTFALNPSSVRLLEGLGVWSQLPEDARTAIHDMQIQGDARTSALNFSAWQQSVRELGWIVDAAALEQALSNAVEAVVGHGAGQVHRVMDPNAQVEAALLAVADGQASLARAALGVGFDSKLYGQHAVAARLVASQPHQNTARQWFMSPDILALLPFDRPTLEHSYGLVWSVSSQRAQSLLAMDATAFEEALNEATGGAAQASNAVGRLKLASPRAAWPLSNARAERVVGEGWVLVGDAAHVVHPLAGQGLNLGLGDVQTLSEVLASKESWRSLGDLRLLSRYARQRALPVGAMSLTTDALQLLFAHPSPLARELRNRGMGLVEHLPVIKRWLTREALGS